MSAENAPSRPVDDSTADPAAQRVHVWLTCGCGGEYDLPADTKFPAVLYCHYHRGNRTTVVWEALSQWEARRA